MKELGVLVPMVNLSTCLGDADTVGLKSVCHYMLQSGCHAIFGASRTDRGPLSTYKMVFDGKVEPMVVIADFPVKWAVAAIAGALKTTTWLGGTTQVMGVLVFGSASLLLGIPVASPVTVEDRFRLIMIRDNPIAYHSGCFGDKHETGAAGYV